MALVGWLVSIAPQLKALWGWGQESCREILGRRHLWMGAQMALEVGIGQSLKGEHVCEECGALEVPRAQWS